MAGIRLDTAPCASLLPGLLQWPPEHLQNLTRCAGTAGLGRLCPGYRTGTAALCFRQQESHECTLMLDMEVIVRRQDQEHCTSITCMIRHYVARRAQVIEDHPHNAADRAQRPGCVVRRGGRERKCRLPMAPGGAGGQNSSYALPGACVSCRDPAGCDPSCRDRVRSAGGSLG